MAGSDRKVSATDASALARAVDRQEQYLVGTLALWSVASVVAGAGLWRAGRRRAGGRGGPLLVGVGRQAVGWGLVDAAIAGWGLRGLARRASSAQEAGAPPSPQARARRLATVTGVNAALDVGYLVGAARLVRSPRTRHDGLGMIPQALFLLWLDLRHSVGFLGHVRGRGSAAGGRRA